MKKLLLLLVLFTSGISFSWDTTAAKYFPLQVGNVWVYSGSTTPYPYCYGTFRARYKVTGMVDSLGKTYYRLALTTILINGNCPCSIPFFSYPIRIDSTSMNIYNATTLGCQQNEVLVDSLKARIRDTTWICRPTFSSCGDTLMFNICNTNISAKLFSRGPIGGANAARYGKGIGVISWVMAEAGYSCVFNILGSVINGVVCGDTSMLVGINQISSEIPNQFSLSQNYPNPFNPTTKIRFAIPSNVKSKTSNVRINVYDVLGREVSTLVNEVMKPGTYEVDFDGTNYPSGVYYYTLYSNSFTETKRMVLLK